jgi:transposase
VKTKAKNEVHAALMRRLISKPSFSDLFGKRGREWLERVELPACERETVDGCLRQFDFCEREIGAIERVVATEALRSPEVRRLMTVPGVNVIAAATFIAAIGDIRRFESPRKLVGYLGLDPKVRQSGQTQATHGRISKQDRRRAATPSSRRAGPRSEHRARSTPSMRGPAPGAAIRSRSSPRRESSPACSGACSLARRTTPTPSRR